MNAKVLHVNSIDEHLTLLDIVITGDKVNESRFSTAALTYNGYSLSLGDGEVDILQHPLVGILKAHVTELYLVIEVVKTLGDSRVFDSVLCLKDLVDTLHRCKSLGDIVTSFGYILERVDDGVEHYRVIDEYGTGKSACIQNEYASEP